MVERERERQNTGAAHETVGRLDAGKVAEGRRCSDRASGIGAVPPRTKLAATAAPVPLEEPPVKCSLDHGLRGGGKGKSKLGPWRSPELTHLCSPEWIH